MQRKAEGSQTQTKPNKALSLRKKGCKGFWVNYRSVDSNCLAKMY